MSAVPMMLLESSAAAELIWSRPLGLAALALPLLLALLARARRDPEVVATGTLALWREIDALAPAVERRSRPRVPPATWVFIAALVFGALGLAGPRIVAPEGPRTWTILVDDASSTALPIGPETALTRIEHALDDTLAWLAENADSSDLVRWIRGDGDERVLRADEPPERAWLTHVRVGGRLDLGTRLAALDRPGTIAVTDRAPGAPPEHAGWFASGGPAVPGPIATSADALIVWDGDSIAELPAEAVAGRVVLDASAGELPSLVGALVEVWAGARGVTVVRGRADGRLVVRAHAAPGANDRQRIAGRDGWRVNARGIEAPSAGAQPSSRRWLVAKEDGAQERPLIAWAPGRIDVYAGGLDVIDGDPAQVAVSFAELFDAALLPHPDVVALADRAAAGAGARREPEVPARAVAPSSPLTRAPLDAWLAGLAAFAALVGLAVAREG